MVLMGKLPCISDGGRQSRCKNEYATRIKVLLELFPQARFVHIVRTPYVVMPSTLHTWRTLHRVFGLQQPTFAGLEQQVLHNYLHMFTKLEETRGLVAPGRFYELRYEELGQDPIG